LVLVFLLCVPSAVGLAVLGRPIIALIFEHGRFTAFDTAQTGDALAAYAVGLAGYAAVKVLSPAFYALGDARTPMLISLGSIAVNYVMNSLLVGPFGHVGLAFSTSTVALINFILLAVFMRRRVGRLEGSRLGLTLARIFIASIPMAAVAWLVNEFCASLPLAGITLKLVSVSASITSAAMVFYVACRLLRIEELKEAIDAVGGRFLRVFRRK
jgi:putative peptidoglycan lipid II flippase